ncbi:hypothetical protein HY797_03485 [Candidatus Falkowbacteria bacterium]|nr:hypothetical protein [Candidatus Falkowbacteria bacterium]
MDMGKYTWEEICSLYFEGATWFFRHNLCEFTEMVRAEDIGCQGESPTDEAFKFFVGLGQEFRKNREVAA